MPTFFQETLCGDLMMHFLFWCQINTVCPQPIICSRFLNENSRILKIVLVSCIIDFYNIQIKTFKLEPQYLQSYEAFLIFLCQIWKIGRAKISCEICRDVSLRREIQVNVQVEVSGSGINITEKLVTGGWHMHHDYYEFSQQLPPPRIIMHFIFPSIFQFCPTISHFSQPYSHFSQS